jgi:diphthine-ammonia ligase
MESCLACHKVLSQDYDVACLVTFVLNSWPSMCHPLPVMRLQSKSIGIPHLKVKIKEPYREGYRKAISHLMKTEGIKGIVTGDIYVVDDIHGLWMESVCEGLEIDVIMPLWGQDPRIILKEEVSEGFRAMFTCVKQPWFDEEWPGRELSNNSVEDLLALADTYGIDPCGEKGEYHTMVIDGPIFKEAIEISKFSKEKQNTRLFIRISEFSLKPKSPLLKRR